LHGITSLKAPEPPGSSAFLRKDAAGCDALGKSSRWSLRHLTKSQRRKFQKIYAETIERWRSENPGMDFPTPTLREFYHFLLYRTINYLHRLLREDPAAFEEAMRRIKRRGE